jgi:hypothetical protein
MRKITLFFVLIAFAATVKAQYTVEGPLLATTGWGWTTITLADNQKLVIDENFQDWPANHNLANNSSATKGRAAATAYTNWEQEITLGDGTKANITLFKCASTPTGLSQNKIEYTAKTDPDDGVYEGKALNYRNGAIADPEKGEPLSVGFLEVGRIANNGSDPAAHSTVTLPPIAGAQIIQYSYSSLGGNKRAIKLERSVDNGTTWTIVRNSPKADVDDPTTLLGEGAAEQLTNPYLNGYYCSAAGVYIEDIIGDGSETVTLRFSINDGLDGNGNVAAAQDYRLHDLKVIALSGTDAIPTVSVPLTQIIGQKGQITITGAQAPVTIYTPTGQKAAALQTGSRTLTLPAGIYLVSEQGQPARKVIVK